MGHLSSSDSSPQISLDLRLPGSANAHGTQATEVDSQEPLWHERLGPLVAREVSSRTAAATDN